VRHLLLVSHFFPPMGGGGVQRVTKFVKYLAPQGWRVTVLAGRPEDYWMRDETLLEDVPATARVVRTAAASGLGVWRRLPGAGTSGTSRRSSRLFGSLRRAAAWCLVPDSYVGWRPFALRAARALLQEDPPLALMSSGPPETNHLVALQLHRDTGLPWLADFRDPWFGLHLHPAPTAWHRARHARWERTVLREANAVVATTTWLGDLLAARAPGAARVHVIRNGYDPADFATAPPAAAAPGGRLRLVHTGMLTLTRSAAGLLQGLRQLRQTHPELRDAFAVELVGARESANDELVQRLGLADCVHLRDYVPHRQAIEAMREADVLVLIKHVEPRFRGLVPGKLYEYMGAGRPILALVPPSEAADLVRDGGWGEVAPPDDVASIAAALLRLLQHRRAGSLHTVYPCRGRQQFERPAQAGELAALLDGLADAGRDLSGAPSRSRPSPAEGRE
jgi:glycosyltransferase involved in cell wall biosynthesis